MCTLFVFERTFLRCDRSDSNASNSNSSDSSENEPDLQLAWSNVSSLKIVHLDSVASLRSIASECTVTPLSCATPAMRDFADAMTPAMSPPLLTAQSSITNRNRSDCLNYAVFPAEVRALSAEYSELCAQYYRLGVVLAERLRHADAKREFGRAMKVFRKLKIKPALYEAVLAEVRKQQRTSFTATTGKERAQKLAMDLKSPSSRGNRSRAPNSPSTSFSFSFAEAPQEMAISPYLLATAQ